MKALITYGPTRERIDGIRFLTNGSSGKTGAFLVHYLAENGWEVHAIKAQELDIPSYATSVYEFCDFQDLHRAIQNLLAEKKFDAVIHLAAVSDFSIKDVIIDGKRIKPPIQGKLDSQKTVQIKLKPNVRILEKIKDYAKQKSPLVMGFKLTNGKSKLELEKDVFRLSTHPRIDFVVHNDFSRINGLDEHPFSIYQGKTVVANGATKLDLGTSIKAVLTEAMQ